MVVNIPELHMELNNSCLISMPYRSMDDKQKNMYTMEALIARV